MKKIFYSIISLMLATAICTSTDVFADEPDENPEPTFTMTFDFNGGATYNGQGTLVRQGVSFAPSLNEPFLVSCIDYDHETDECFSLDIKKGKELSYVTVNGERHEYDADDAFMFNQDTVIKYFWTDLELSDYTIEDDNGNTITFSEVENHEYHLNVNMFSFSMTDEELAAADISREEYEAGKSAIIEAVKDQGSVVAYFEIEVFEIPDCGNGPCMCQTDTGEVPCENAIHEGPFDIRIKYTDEMAGFDIYKLVYVEMDENGNVTVEGAVTLTLQDGYLVGTLPHLSGYALIGTNTVPGAPNTGSPTTNANASLSLFAIIGTLTLATITIVFKKA